jgi:hypothetical protein
MFEAKTTSTKTILYRPLVMAEGQWTLDIETAWAELFKILTYHMKSAYGNSNSNNGAGIKDDHSSGSDMSTSISNSTDIAKTFPRRLEIVLDQRVPIYEGNQNYAHIAYDKSSNIGKNKNKVQWI